VSFAHGAICLRQIPRLRNYTAALEQRATQGGASNENHIEKNNLRQSAPGQGLGPSARVVGLERIRVKETDLGGSQSTIPDGEVVNQAVEADGLASGEVAYSDQQRTG
jgi:hypothetical protein